MASVVGKPLAINLGVVKRNAVIVENSPQIKSEPGIDRNTVLVDNTSDVRCKRRINFQYTGMQPASVARRNARERNRVKQVNNGFATLRNHIPLSVAAALGSPSSSATGRGASKKLSKVETLRMAVEYIRSLQDLLDQSGGNTENYFKESKMELSPVCSESSQSPPPSTSSYQSEPSYGGSNGGSYNHDNYDPMSPEDEELLDVISWWQQSQ
ncbi:achaete-scute homolog 1a-like [Rhodnius prolixus]|uniref:BHLH domain-containing protein n=1 Tax=Rhodnius prolixus TaxID=13249 RepID=T1HC65_RHOPR